MAHSIVSNGAVQGETFLPGQTFVFGDFVLWANSLGHLEQVDSHAPGHQVRFGSLNYVADIRGDSTFDGFETVATAPHHLDEHGLNLSSGSIQEIAPATAPALDLEQIESSEDGKLNPATDAAVQRRQSCTQTRPRVESVSSEPRTRFRL